MAMENGKNMGVKLFRTKAFFWDTLIYSPTTLVFLVSFNSDIWFCVDFGVVLAFWTQMVFLGLWQFSKLFLGLLLKLKNFIFCVSFNFNFCFWPKSGSFCGFWGLNGIFSGVRVRFKYCFGVYSCCWTTFIFYVSFNSSFGFWLNFGVVFDFLGH